MPAVQQVVDQHKSVFRQGLGPVFCMEHDSIHNATTEMLADQHVVLLPQPSKSPDFNKPIEHVFGKVKGWEQATLSASSRAKSIKGWRRIVANICFNLVPAARVNQSMTNIQEWCHASVEAVGAVQCLHI